MLDLTNTIGNVNFDSNLVWEIFKWFSVVGLVMYVVFAFVVLRQTFTMTESVESEANPHIKMFAWVHLILAAGLLVYTVAYLP